MRKYRLEYGGLIHYFDSKDEFISWVIGYLSGDGADEVKFFYPDGSWYGDAS